MILGVCDLFKVYQGLQRCSSPIDFPPQSKTGESQMEPTTAPIIIHRGVDASETGVRAILSQQQGIPVELCPYAFSTESSPLQKWSVIWGTTSEKSIFLWLEGEKYPYNLLTDHKILSMSNQQRDEMHTRPDGYYSLPALISYLPTDLVPRTVRAKPFINLGRFLHFT